MVVEEWKWRRRGSLVAPQAPFRLCPVLLANLLPALVGPQRVFLICGGDADEMMVLML